VSESKLPTLEEIIEWPAIIFDGGHYGAILMLRPIPENLPTGTHIDVFATESALSLVIKTTLLYSECQSQGQFQIQNRWVYFCKLNDELFTRPLITHKRSTNSDLAKQLGGIYYRKGNDMPGRMDVAKATLAWLSKVAPENQPSGDLLPNRNL
jgi:hypothetical protein